MISASMPRRCAAIAASANNRPSKGELVSALSSRRRLESANRFLRSAAHQTLMRRRGYGPNTSGIAVSVPSGAAYVAANLRAASMTE